MMQTDVKAASLSASGTAFAGPTRVKGLVVHTTGDTAASIELLNGGASGTSMFSIDLPNADTVSNIWIPGEGIKFSTDVYATLVSCDVVVFYG